LPPRAACAVHSESWADVVAKVSQNCKNYTEKDNVSIMRQLLVSMSDRIAQLEGQVKQLEC
jgi:hypothetical protein